MVTSLCGRELVLQHLFVPNDQFFVARFVFRPQVECTSEHVRLPRPFRGRSPAVHRLESGAGFRVRVRVLRRALARGDLKRLQRFQDFVSDHVHLGTGVDNVVTDNVLSPWVRVKVYRPLDPGVPLTLAVAVSEP
jgi:hypothetical protein